MSDKEKLSDNNLEKVTGGAGDPRQEGIREGQIYFTYLPKDYIADGMSYVYIKILEVSGPCFGENGITQPVTYKMYTYHCCCGSTTYNYSGSQTVTSTVTALEMLLDQGNGYLCPYPINLPD